MKSDYTIIVTALSDTLTDGKRLAILDVFDVSLETAEAIGTSLTVRLGGYFTVLSYQEEE